MPRCLCAQIRSGRQYNDDIIYQEEQKYIHTYICTKSSALYYVKLKESSSSFTIIMYLMRIVRICLSALLREERALRMIPTGVYFRAC